MEKIRQSQNFINNPRLVTTLLDMTDVSMNDLVVEGGPGTGVITKQLTERAGTVIVVEQDPDLARKLMHNVAPNVQVITGDFLNYPLPDHKYKVVANLPFNLTADIIRKLFMGQENQPDSAYLIMQKEAAEKFTGKPKATLTSTLLGISFKVSVLNRINRSAFVPTPKVDAAFVAFIKRDKPFVDKSEIKDFQDFVAYEYIHTRRGMGIGDLDISRWVNLFEAFKKHVPSGKKAIVRGSMAKLAREQSRLPKQHRTRRLWT